MEKQPARPAKPTIKMEMMFVTPHLAASWLSKNGTNRSISDHRVAALANDIVSGNFLPTHQGVAFDDTDHLCDGQHRLSAVVKADRGIWMFVASNVPTETMSVLDSGRSRALHDRVAISEGWENSKGVIAIARIIAEFELGKHHGVSDPQVIEVAKRERTNIVWAVGKRAARFTSYAPVAAALAYAKPIVSDKTSEEFANRLITGEMLRLGSPILALRNHLDKCGTSAKSSRTRSGDFRRTLDAIRRFVAKEDCKILRDCEYGAEWVIRGRQDLGLPTVSE